MILRVVAALAASLAVVAPADARTYVFGANGEHSASVKPVFSLVPSAGFAPYRITLKTASESPRTFRIDSTSAGLQSWRSDINLTASFALSCPPQSETTHEILVPVLPDIRGAGFGAAQSVTLQISTPGFPPKSDSQQGLSAPGPFRAMSADLAKNSLGDLNKAVVDAAKMKPRGLGGTRETFAAEFRPETLPSDWRAYSGVDELFTSASDWAAVPAPARAAIASWVHSGGHLIYFSSSGNPDPPSLDLPESPIAGKITFRSWDGRALDPSEVFNAAEQRETEEATVAADIGSAFDSKDAPLRDALGARTFNSSLVVVLLLAFAILVGPVNLFKLAGPGRRHRIFVTTPVISVATSLLLLIVIFVQDGIGGKGRRFAHLALAHDARQAVVKQAQYSRAGVLLGRRFPLPEETVLFPAPVGDATRWNAYTRDPDGPPLSFSAEDGTYSGDWFRSRSEQAHLATTVRPTRARLERTASPENGPPTITSALEFPLEKLYVRDGAGNCWQSDGAVAPGTSPKLSAIGGDDYVEARRRIAGEDSGTPDKNTFFALADTTSPAAETFFVPTLGSIRWKNDILFVTGTLPPAP